MGMFVGKNPILARQIDIRSGENPNSFSACRLHPVQESSENVVLGNYAESTGDSRLCGDNRLCLAADGTSADVPHPVGDTGGPI